MVKQDGISSLFLRQDDGSYLLVQVAKRLHWDDAELMEFASGLTVTAAATVTYG